MSSPSQPLKPLPDNAWVSVRHLQRMAASGEAIGLGMGALMAQAGLDPAQLNQPDGTVPLAMVETMLAAMQKAYGEPLLGLQGANELQPAMFGALGHVLQACTTFGDMLDVFLRYRGMLSNIGHASVQHGPGVVELSWDCLVGSPLLRRHACEYVIATVAVVTRLVAQGHESAQPLQVRFSHRRPVKTERLREYFEFFQCPVQFEQGASAITYPSSLLQLRLPYGDAVLKDLLEQHARQVLQLREQARGVDDDVRQLVKALVLTGTCSKEAVAEQLGMSPRSLHRKLQELGTNYRDIVDVTRLEQARSQLGSGSASAGELAERLGFSSRQAFMRWFRHQTGLTPSQYRQCQGRGAKALNETHEADDHLDEAQDGGATA